MTTSNPDREDVRAHLAMMLDVVTRMAENSRACKTWAVTLVAAILVVVARFGTTKGETALDADAVWIALGPAILFWILDSYYLALERWFRSRYNDFVAELHANRLEPSDVFNIAPPADVIGQTIRSLWRFVNMVFYGTTVGMIIVVFAVIAR